LQYVVERHLLHSTFRFKISISNRQTDHCKMIPIMKNVFNSVRILLLLVLTLSSASAAIAQSYITVDASQQFTTFRFLDSNGTQDKDYKGVYSGAYSFGFRNIGEKGFMFRGSIGMTNGGATHVVDAMNYSWQLKYATAKAGIGWIFGHGKARPYFTASPYYSRLLKATQTLNNEDFDLIGSRSFRSDDYGVDFAPGVQYAVNDKISIYAEATYRLGIQNLEMDGEQTSHNRAVGISLGLAFNLTK
jgi:hypothetical protein